ncbi:MAG: prolyl hydroxylase family protein [Gammaproteobacteria bacterium]
MNKHNINIIYKNPLIFIVDDFLSKNFCNQIINLNNKFLPSETTSYSSNDYRKSESAIISDDKILSKIFSGLESKLNLDKKCFEKIQIQKYQKGGEYKKHFDALSKNNFKAQRQYSLIIYLNDNFSGGETCFERINKSIKPKSGRLLLFQNCLNNTNYPHPNSLHSGKYVSNGTKFILNSWSYQKHLNLDIS